MLCVCGNNWAPPFRLDPLLTTFHTRPPRPARRKPRSWEHTATKSAGGTDWGVQRQKETRKSETVIQDPDSNSVCVCVHLGHMIQNEGRRLQAYMGCDSSLLSHAGMFTQPAPFSNLCMHSCLSNTIHTASTASSPRLRLMQTVWNSYLTLVVPFLQTPETPC